MLVFTKQFGTAAAWERWKKEKYTSPSHAFSIDNHMGDRIENSEALGILSEISALRICLCREELSRCQYYTGEMAENTKSVKQQNKQGCEKQNKMGGKITGSLYWE